MKIATQKITSAVMCLLLGAALIASSVVAASALEADLNREIGIAVKYEYNDIPISGVRFDLYKIADMTSDGQLKVRPDFAKYKISYDNLTPEKMKTLSDTLCAYIMRDGIAPISSAVTNENGYAVFRSETKQTAGLYLVIGEKKTIGKNIYTPETLMISMPTLDTDGKTHLYKITAIPKGEMNTAGSKTQIKVSKVWKDDKSKGERPHSVTVQLMRDDVIYSEVTLSEANNWRYSWKDLNEKYRWTVAEKEVPDGYTVAVTVSEKNYIIVNTGGSTEHTTGGTTEPGNTSDTTGRNDTTKPSDTKTTGGSDFSTSASASSSTSPSPSTTNSSIPQTGMLEWPIPIMAEIGAVLFIIGIALCVKQRNKDEK